jgi:hypothetical protein
MNPHPINCEVQIYEDEQGNKFLDHKHAKFDVLPRAGDFVQLPDMPEHELKVAWCSIIARGELYRKTDTTAVIRVYKVN